MRFGQKIRGNASFSGPKAPDTTTSTISIRNMLRDVKNVDSKLYINANGSENFMFNQFAVWINKRGAAVRWLTAPANRMPNGNGNPAIPTVILSIFLLYNKV